MYAPSMALAWIDGHLDLASLAVEGRDVLQPTDGIEGCISMPDLAASAVRVVLGTIFTAPVDHRSDHGACRYIDAESAHAAGLLQLQVYQQLEGRGHLRMQHEGLDVPDADEPLALVLLMEGADPIRDATDVAIWRSHGLRIVGLTWANGTRYAGGNSSGGGLSDAGRDLVEALDESGILHDASHCSDAALDDLLSHAKGSIVATHSNSRVVLGTENQRHLSDDHARAILARDGVIGLNLFTKFLARDRRATIDDCVSHVLHFCELAGNRRQVALGSDFDGGFGPGDLPVDLDHPRKLGALAEALAEAGFSEEDMAAFAHGNWLRVLS